MSPRSAIRFRLRTALFIAGAFSIFLTAYFAASYISIKHSLTSRSDAEVYEQIDSILHNLRSVSDEREFPRLAAVHNSTGEASIALKLVRFDNPVHVIASLGSSRIKALLDSHIFFLKELPLDVRIGNNTVRVLARSNKLFTIFAAINMIAFQEVFDDMLRTYLLLLITGILASFLIGSFTARLALKPLKLLVDSARSIKNEPAGSSQELPTNTKTLEINELALVINDILDARDRNIAALRDFTADAAHELRTPLTILKGELEVDLRTKKVSEIEKASIESNLEEVQKLIRIVEDLLTLARAEQPANHSQVASHGSWRMSELISEVLERLKPIADAKNIFIQSQLNEDIMPSLPHFEVERVVFNIILNAIQYTPARKEISILSERSAAGEYILLIQDEGIGIASDQIQNIFDRFWRADISRSRLQGGTGLGLTIAKTFADVIGMRIECTSELGVGTTMRCIFPEGLP